MPYYYVYKTFKMKFYSILVAALLLNTLNTTAQSSLLERIPTQEFAVVSFNGKSIGEKSKEAKGLIIFDSIDQQFNSLLTEYHTYLKDENTVITTVEEVEEVIDDVEEQSSSDYDKNYYSDNFYTTTPNLSLDLLFPALANNGAKYGMNHLTNYYYVIGMSDTINHSALIFEKSDEAKFNSFIGLLVPKEHTDKYIRLANGYHYFYNNDDQTLIAWNNKTIAIIEYSIPYNWNYDKVVETTEEKYYESYEERLNAEAKKKEDLKRAKVEALIDLFFVAKPELSLKYNEYYQKTLLKQADLSYFINNALGNQSFSNLFKSSYQNSNKLLNLYKDNYAYGYLDFNSTSIDFSSVQHVGDHYLKQVKEMNKIKFNKAMYKYIDGENLQAIIGFSANYKPFYEMTRDIYIDVFSNMKYSEDWYGTAADIGFTFFDEDELFDLIKGDFVFAITDLKEFETEYTSYDYDEDYNRTEVTKTKKETLPEFVSMATIGNEKLRNKIIKLMEQTDVIVKKGHYYELQEPASKWKENSKAKPLSIYYMIKNDLLIVTNDESILIDNKGNGLAKAKQMSKEPTKLMKKNNVFAYWIPKKTLEKIPSEYRVISSLFDDAAKTVTSFEMKGVKNKKNLFTSSITINLEEEKTGSLMISLELINDIIKNL